MSKITLENLPNDIIYEITKHLCIKEICIFEKVCKVIHKKIRCFHNNILTNLLLENGKNYNITDIKMLRTFFYNSLHNYLSFQVFNENARFYDIWIYNDYQDNYQNGYKITQNLVINKLFLKIFYSFVYDHFYTVVNYKNKLELYALYNFLQIEVYQNKHDFSRLHLFLESINEKIYYNIRLKYYNSILNSFHENPFYFTFDQMVTVSSTVISISMFKKIMGYRILNLQKSNFHQCCIDCNEENLIEICDFKLAHWDDDLVSHNYLEFKKLLQEQSIYYYTFLQNRETFVLNNIIYIKNPCSNRRMRLNGSIYRSFINTINSDPFMKNYHIRMLRNISKRREYLRKKIFT